MKNSEKESISKMATTDEASAFQDGGKNMAKEMYRGAPASATRSTWNANKLIEMLRVSSTNFSLQKS